MQNANRILVVDDDHEIRRLLGRYLTEQGFQVTLAASRRECNDKIATERIDLAILDVMLPDGSGLDLCRALRARVPSIPTILLTALKEDVDRIIGLEVGADDYLGKPFNPRELLARVRAVLRRSGETTSAEPPSTAAIFHFANLSADPTTREVRSSSGHEIVLTGAEFGLLRVFLERPGRILSRDQLLGLTQGKEAGVFDRSSDVLMSRLRRKLGEASDLQIFKTVRNGGYQLAARVESSAVGEPPQERR